MKKYKFIIGDNLMYNSTHLRRVRWYNLLFVRAGLVNVIEWEGVESDVKVAEGFARLYFKKRGMTPHVMGHEL